MHKLLGLLNTRYLFIKKSFKGFSFCLIAVSAFLSLCITVEDSAGQGLGNLQVIPTRIVFDGRKRSAQVNVINNGVEPATYRISFKNMRMKEDGSYEDIEKALPNEKFAEDLIRYSPRQVEIQPGESQIVRLLLRKKRGLPPGEYRSHMLFRAIPPETSGKSIESLAGEKGEIKIQLIPIFGITIPVIVRHGKGSATAGMEDLEVNDPKKPGKSPMLTLRLNRQGNRSLFGDMTAKFKPENGGDELEIGRVNGVAVFTPNKSRIVSLKLSPPEGVELKRGLLQVVYRENPDDGDKILAEKQLRVP
ncbi:MAG: hypothetical protein NPINA01_09100 [Nitrospinaceae bacterium]|nr:MAG: hypothetical protein NPINA01_09100 [Nitrospinaceae bacterium]